MAQESGGWLVEDTITIDIELELVKQVERPQQAERRRDLIGEIGEKKNLSAAGMFGSRQNGVLALLQCYNYIYECFFECFKFSFAFPTTSHPTGQQH